MEMPERSWFCAACMSLPLRKRICGLARRAADILTANVQKQEKGGGWPNRASQAALAGMSHGGSGFLPGLAKLDYLLKSTEYEPVLSEALAYERSLYGEKWHNWADLRQEEGEGRWQAGAWCHGFGGIAAARLACLPYVDGKLKEVMEEDLRLAEHGFLALRRRKGMCLCHGNMGMLLLLERYGKTFPSEQLAQVKNALSGAALEELEKGRLMPQEKYARGLMSGMVRHWLCLPEAGRIYNASGYSGVWNLNYEKQNRGNVFLRNTKVCQKRIASGKNVCYTDELTGERHDGNLSGCIQESTGCKSYEKVSLPRQAVRRL